MDGSGAAVRRVLRPPQVRGANRAAILHLLRHNDYLSRADLARHSGLSEGTVSRIMTGLIEDGLVREDGAENSTGGRPGRRLALEPRRVAFGAEIQNWETRCAISSMHGHIADTRRFRTPASAEEALDRIAQSFLEFSDRLGGDRFPGIGICMRGVVNSEKGVLVVGNHTDWVNVPIREILEARLHEPVFVENNVRAAALAEYNYGPPEVSGSSCFLFVKVDEGVGMGILIDGKIYHGPRMAAGEFGQMVIAFSSTSQRHDRPGCLERLASDPVVCARYAELTGVPMAGSVDTSSLLRKIGKAAEGGDPAARQTLEEAARYLGIGISNVAWGLDAEVIVIDGALTEAWGLVDPLIREQLPDNDHLLGLRKLLLRPSALGGEAALIGAATLPFAAVFATGEQAVQA